MLSAGGRAAFTLIEVIVALVILSAAVLGLAASASGLATASASAEVRALALQAVEDRIARVRLDPRYGGLDTLYAAVESGLFSFPAMSRTTTVQHVTGTPGQTVDYKRVSVTVSGAPLTEPVSRSIVVGAP